MAAQEKQVAEMKHREMTSRQKHLYARGGDVVSQCCYVVSQPYCGGRGRSSMARRRPGGNARAL